MIDQLQKINIFVGHFGSGKTEMAINFALQSVAKGEKTTLIDLDIVNPFFRSSEVSEMLKNNNINLIAPNFAGTTVDIPSLPPSIQGVFSKSDETIIFDVGGDPDGARALSIYHEFFEKVHYNMYFLINTRRPFTMDIDSILEIMKEIEDYSRLKITHLVSNTNLSYETTMPVIEEGIKIVEAISQKTKLPLAYINIPRDLEAELPKEYEKLKFPMDFYMREWHQ